MTQLLVTNVPLRAEPFGSSKSEMDNTSLLVIGAAIGGGLGRAEDAPNPPPLLGELLLADAMERGAVRASTLGARGREMNPEHKGT